MTICSAKKDNWQIHMFDSKGTMIDTCSAGAMNSAHSLIAHYVDPRYGLDCGGCLPIGAGLGEADRATGWRREPQHDFQPDLEGRSLLQGLPSSLFLALSRSLWVLWVLWAAPYGSTHDILASWVGRWNGGTMFLGFIIYS